MNDSTPPLRWRKSSRCDSSTCVEVAIADGHVAIRDSKTADGPILRFSRAEWATFVAGVRGGDFELN